MFFTNHGRLRGGVGVSVNKERKVNKQARKVNKKERRVKKEESKVFFTIHHGRLRGGFGRRVLPDGHGEVQVHSCCTGKQEDLPA